MPIIVRGRFKKRLNTEDKRYSIIYNAVEYADKEGLGTLARIINKIELGYARLAGTSEKKEDQIINLNQLQDLEQIFVKRIQEIIDVESLLDAEDFSYIVYLWEAFDKEGAQKFIFSLFEDDSQKLKYICAMASRWNGSNGSGWNFHSKHYSSYISDEEVYNLIQKYDKKKLDEFSDIEQIKLASFVLNYPRGEMDHVNEQKARELVEEWKHL